MTVMDIYFTRKSAMTIYDLYDVCHCRFCRIQVESLEIATLCGQTFLFLGAERTSTIFVFNITVRV